MNRNADEINKLLAEIGEREASNAYRFHNQMNKIGMTEDEFPDRAIEQKEM